MDPPPAYPTHLTIPDLRAQIIANSTIIYPHREVTKAADSHLELVVAKAHQATPVGAHGTGKHVVTVGGPSTHAAATGSLSSHGTIHYAVLVRRSYDKDDIKILIKGQPQDNVVGALEWMLERTERDVHDLVVRCGRPVNKVGLFS
ncbi:hypothetical protein LTR91_015764 [Friedmanniomyces endolithicus]|uniref:Uncharacterized protein n=1 Tax=Friedmanniomyces endolithicus TaxID=329885 RepID=A0AAN6K9A9_9PEZI|nr:hypothetical protein LTR94_004064 [Friedmanniomyces endolithicus]KAK0769753.1 hypothetical protein LTR59_016856 [Friedmanniomyces endolithicus]KAK0771006.1 hypothetical protein LTR75_017773 [Friedmanniomyces endolithicus]KAK0810784.1 hypothetical protein LTR38_003804 [Friedmanniomyces endolithicus]KAK0839951.1 hypothetical protein LTR03_010941 [Friedmanniomyces endolithicus]